MKTSFGSGINAANLLVNLQFEISVDQPVIEDKSKDINKNIDPFKLCNCGLLFTLALFDTIRDLYFILDYTLWAKDL